METASHNSDARRRRIVLLSVFVLGISAIVTQLALLREMLSVFDGNEMVMGILLGNWLLLTGIGSWLGRFTRKLRHPRQLLLPAQLLVAVLPLLQIIALRLLHNALFIFGSMLNATETVCVSFIVLAPFCLVSGSMLTLACSILTRRHEDDDPVGRVLPQKKPYHEEAMEIGRVYIADSLGSIFGGILFSLGLVLLLDHFRALCVPTALNLVLAASMIRHRRVQKLLLLALASLGGLSFLWYMNVLTLQQHNGNVPVLFRADSPYGQLLVTESTHQYNFLENGVPLFSTHNTEQVEETVHYAMAQRPNARRVLLIGGGASGTAREILKYGSSGTGANPVVYAGGAARELLKQDVVEQVVYVELDPLIVTTARRFAREALADPRIRIVNTDGRLFVRQTNERFDVVIVDVPEPSTMQWNRFYTVEFYSELRRILSSSGVVSFSLGHYENYVSPELARMLGSVQRTLRESFRHTLLLPGGRVFVLASDGELTTDIAPRIAARNIKVNLMTQNYLGAMLTPDRLAALEQSASEDAAPNEDFNPILYLYHLRYWVSIEPYGTGLLVGALLTVLVACPFLLRGPSIVVFAGGFAATTLEMILLLGFQILCGSVYHQVGILLTVFMAGLVVGAWLTNRPKEFSRRGTLCLLATVLSLFAALLPVMLVQVSAMGFASARVTVPALTFCLAAIVGMEFPVALQPHRTEPTTTASALYTADFIGAALGALLASTLLIPRLGVTTTCWLTAGLNFLAAGLVWVRKKRR